MNSGSQLLSDALWVLLVPPIITALWFLMARGWTKALGTDKRPRVQGWVRFAGWFVFGGLYLIGIGLFVYAHFLKP